jgi:hypothetical protein
MTIKYAVALVLSLAGSGLIAACGSAAPGIVLKCRSVLDSTGYKNGPLTTDLAIASLTKVQFAAEAASIPRGKPTRAVTRTLDVMAVELMGYSGSKLSDDAQAFAVAEENYHPDGLVDTSYAQPMSRDILALERDCPAGVRLGRRWLGGAS